ncbi:MAG: sigma-70 family RNA polymerase sigma factor [Fidelibacterota bacterium]
MKNLTKSEPLRGEEIVREYVSTKNPAVREEAILAFLPLVKHIVGRMHYIGSGVIRKRDAIQAGVIGVIDALEKYDPERGVSFKSYAYPRINGAVIDTVRAASNLNKEYIHDLRVISQAVDAHRLKFGSDPSPEELAAYVGLSLERIRKVRLVNRFQKYISLDDNIILHNGEKSTWLDIIPDPEQKSPEKSFEEDALKRELRQIVQQLPERQRLILALYYYEELTLADIGKVLDISESRVSQILSETLRSIKKKVVL